MTSVSNLNDLHQVAVNIFVRQSDDNSRIPVDLLILTRPSIIQDLMTANLFILISSRSWLKFLSFISRFYSKFTLLIMIPCLKYTVRFYDIYLL